MKKKHIFSNSDDGMLSLPKDFFKISRFRDLLLWEIRERLMQRIRNNQQQSQGAIIKSLAHMEIAEEMTEINSINLSFSKIVCYSG
ncbi:hypothetical protein [Trichormus azollae]|jgi:hypothetical protein|uniref:Uncharacterized protein n=1 Tax=Nostoc azollae (strain 0708) TaxID=551115 RepID=D7E0E4_NOSA0|nr:hypothetical protein [Trichormus azollae]ADI63053.1 hypothetical protein Aazo_0552 ['Nostoc azollae' 0708]